MILTLDIEKADDRVWSFWILQWPEKISSCCINWIDGCISVYFSVLINGSPSGSFPTLQGFRERDPLSLSLFNLVADVFSLLIFRGISQNLFRDFLVGSEVVVVCHLQYANETLCSLKMMVQIDVKHAI